MLTPTAVGATSGFMGLAIVAAAASASASTTTPTPRSSSSSSSGELMVDLDGVPQPLHADQGMMIPIGMRHRFRNVGTTEARLVFHLGPLAPRPELGHVDTEDDRRQTRGADGARPARRRPPEAAEAVR